MEEKIKKDKMNSKINDEELEKLIRKIIKEELYNFFRDTLEKKLDFCFNKLEYHLEKYFTKPPKKYPFSTPSTSEIFIKHFQDKEQNKENIKENFQNKEKSFIVFGINEDEILSTKLKLSEEQKELNFKNIKNILKKLS